MKVEVDIPDGPGCNRPFDCPLLDWDVGFDEPSCFCNILDKSLGMEHTTGGWEVYKHPDCPSLGGESAKD